MVFPFFQAVYFEISQGICQESGFRLFFYLYVGIYPFSSLNLSFDVEVFFLC